MVIGREDIAAGHRVAVVFRIAHIASDLAYVAADPMRRTSATFSMTLSSWAR